MDDWFPALVAGALLFSGFRAHDYRSAMFVALAFTAFFLWLRRR